VRSYIFTDAEIERIFKWLRTGEEDDALRMTFVEIRRSLRRLFVHMEIMVMVEKELRRQGRWRRRTRLPLELKLAMSKVSEAMMAVRARLGDKGTTRVRKAEAS